MTPRLLALAAALSLLVASAAGAAPTITSTTETSITIGGLECGTSYTITIAGATLTTATKPCSVSISQTIKDGTTISGSVRWEATVAGVTPANIRFYVDGAQLGAQESNTPYCANGDAICAVDTTNLTDGAHAFKVEARDTAGTVVAANTANATVQNGVPPPPENTIAQTIADASTISGEVRWEATVSGPAAVANVRFYVDGGQLGAQENDPPYCARGNAVCSVDTATLANGGHAFKVESRNAAGNVVAANTANATVENNQAPTFQESTWAAGINTPTAMAFAPDGRLFVAQKAGQLRVVSAAGQPLASPFVTVNVVTPSEKGLLGVAFDPNYAANRYVYVYYTNAADGLNQVSRFTASQANPNLAAAGSETVILDNISGSSADNHNGGAIHFGPDGKLYVAVGDNGTSAAAQDLGSLRGKLLRLNPDGSCPSDNPFVNTPGARCEVYSYGLRNPFTFAFDPQDGRLRINDVGEDSWEEINPGVAGANYGWPACEGPQVVGVGDCNDPAYVYPIHAYAHTLGSAITGGVFYRGSTFPDEFAGDYFYSDFLGDFIRFFDGSDHAWRDANGPVDLKIGPDGALYYASIATGNIQRIQAAGASRPRPS